MIGCGSSYHLALSAAWFWQEELGGQVKALPSSELLQRPEHYLDRKGRPLVIAISRTGGTTETLLALERLRASYGALSVAVTGEANTPIGKACDLELAFDESLERSIVMTRAFTSMLYGLCLLADGIAGHKQESLLREVPAMLESDLSAAERVVRRLAGKLEFKRFIYLGGGALWPVACESALKMTEMAIETALNYRTLEFRHGPRTLLDETTLVTLFSTSEDTPYIPALVNDILVTRASLLLVDNGAQPRERLYVLKTTDCRIESLRPVLLAQVGQQLAYWRAAALGRNPDNPPNLTRTVTLTETNVIS